MKKIKTNHGLSLFAFWAFLTSVGAQIPTNSLVLNTPGDEFANQICFSSNHELFVGGYTGSNQEAKTIFLKKIQEPALGGAVIWHKEYDHPAFVENLRDLKIAPDGHLLLLIEQRTSWNLSGLQSANCMILKVNSDGDVIWQTTFNGGGKDIPTGIEILSDGNYLVIGTSNSNVGNNSISELLRLPVSADGVLGTPKYLAIDAFAYSNCVDVALGGDGSLYAFNGIQLVKIAPNSNLIWEKSVGENLVDHLLTRLYIKQDGTVLIAGMSGLTTAPEQLDAILMHYSADGEFLWQHTYGDEGIEIIEELIVCEEEDKIVCIGQDTPNDFVLIDGYYFLVTDMLGNEISSTTIGGNSPSFELGLDLTHTSDGRVVAAGVTTTSGNRDVMLLYTDALFFSCSPPGTTTQTTEPRPTSVRILPNPTVGDFRVIQDGERIAAPSQFLLFNTLGELVHTQKMDHAETEISGLSLIPGIYFYAVNNEHHTLSTGKLIVR